MKKKKKFFQDFIFVMNVLIKKLIIIVFQNINYVLKIIKNLILKMYQLKFVKNPLN